MSGRISLIMHERLSWQCLCLSLSRSLAHSLYRSLALSMQSTFVSLCEANVAPLVRWVEAVQNLLSLTFSLSLYIHLSLSLSLPCYLAHTLNRSLALSLSTDGWRQCEISWASNATLRYSLFRSNVAHISQSRPDYGLNSQVNNI